MYPFARILALVAAAASFAVLASCGGSPTTPNGDLDVDALVTDNIWNPVEASSVPLQAVIDTTSLGGEAPFDVTFSAARSASGAGEIIEYAWDLGDGNGASGVEVQHTYAQPGVYLIQLAVRDSADGIASADMEVVVLPDVEAIVAVEDANDPLTLTFTADSVVPIDSVVSSYAYLWEFDDGGTGQGQSVTHTYLKAGTYNVKLSIAMALVTVSCATTSVKVDARPNDPGDGSGALLVTPTSDLVTSGPFGGPFNPSYQDYTLENVGSASLDWSVTRSKNWVTVSPAVGSLDPGETLTVRVSLNAVANILAVGPYADPAIVFRDITLNEVVGTRSVQLTVLSEEGALAVTPAGGMSPSGQVGGPFSNDDQTYTLENVGGAELDWSATANVTWLSLSAASGTLAPGETLALDAGLNANADALAPGMYTGALTISNDSNGSGTLALPLVLTITAAPGALDVLEPGGLDAVGQVGGPFAPASKTYTLENTGGDAITWTASRSQNWLTLSPTTGTLAPGETVTVTLSLNETIANILAPGVYTDANVQFLNQTNGDGDTTRPARLTVNAAGTLNITPANDFVTSGPSGGPFAPATYTYTLSNSGTGAVTWSASKTASWFSLSATSGTLSGGQSTTVTLTLLSAATSLAPGDHTGTVSFVWGGGSGSDARDVELTIAPAEGMLEVTPGTGLDSSGPEGGPFTPTTQSFTLRNTGGQTLNWTAAESANWLALSTVAGTLTPGATTTVSAYLTGNANSLGAGTYATTIWFDNNTTGAGTTSRPAALQVLAGPASMAVTPGVNFNTSGPVGGSFSPNAQTYMIENTGGQALNWSAGDNVSWLTLSQTSGSLAPGATASVQVAVNANANGLAAGTYNGTLTFTNETNGDGNATRTATLQALVPAALAVTSAGGLTSSGDAGGPFSPSAKTYTLENTGELPLNWQVSESASWLSLSATSGTLAAGATASVTVSINTNANGLAAGTYNEVVTITNLTNGTGNTTRAVSLQVLAPPALAVTPAGNLGSSGAVGGPFTPVSQTYVLENTGDSALDWQVSESAAWLSVSPASGTLSAGGTASVVVALNANANSLSPGLYNQTVTVANLTNGVGNTTRTASLTVNGTPATLAVTPVGTLESSGSEGGPFTPASGTYTLENTGDEPLEWVASKTAAWISLVPTTGTLQAGATQTITVAINGNADDLTPGTYNDTIGVTNLTNGNGTTTRTVTLSVDAPGGPALVPIARWDVVPHQRVDAGETLNLGVVAFSRNGIDRVDFQIEGQAPVSVNDMTYNPQSNVYEYWTPLDTDDFGTDAVITVDATVVGTNGGTRTLETLSFVVNPNGTRPAPVAYVDATLGDDATGAVNNASKPYLTTREAIVDLRNYLNGQGQGLQGNGAIVRLRPGTHTATKTVWGDVDCDDEWLTITTDTGGTRDNTILAAPSATLNVGKLRLKGITLDRSAGITYILTASSGYGATAQTWFDDCHLIGAGQWIESSYVMSGNITTTYYTDCLIENVDYATGRSGDIPVARGLTIRHIGNDAFVNRNMIVNCTVDDSDPDISDIPEITNATYYNSGHPSGYSYVVEQAGAFANYEQSPWRYFMVDKLNTQAYEIVEKLSDDAVRLSGPIDESPASVSGIVSTTWHADIFQLWGGVTNNHDNIVIYGLRATNCNYQGIFAMGRGPTAVDSDPTVAQGVALVNVFIEMTNNSQAQASAWGRQVNHMVMWHCTLPNSKFNFWDDKFGTTPDWPVVITNGSFVGNSFYCLTLNHTDSIDWSDCDQNHFQIFSGAQVITRGTNQTLGMPNLTAFGRPTGAPLTGRIVPLRVPADASGQARTAPAAVGAYEP
jgi:hypothetical protein